MATADQVLSMLIPNGGWAIQGDKYEDIEFIEAEPITKKDFEDGFAQWDAWKAQQDLAKATQKTALLDRLGITEDEAKLLLS
jgi:putative protein kinase ArgK-like GTPase of G3E family